MSYDLFKVSSVDPATMTNAQIVRETERISKRQSAICTQLIADGLGSLRPSDMRANPDVHPLVREDLALADRRRALGIEAEMRYGPGLIYMDQLTHVRGSKSYRRRAPERC